MYEGAGEVAAALVHALPLVGAEVEAGVAGVRAHAARHAPPAELWHQHLGVAASLGLQLPGPGPQPCGAHGALPRPARPRHRPQRRRGVLLGEARGGVEAGLGAARHVALQVELRDLAPDEAAARAGGWLGRGGGVAQCWVSGAAAARVQLEAGAGGLPLDPGPLPLVLELLDLIVSVTLDGFPRQEAAQPLALQLAVRTLLPRLDEDVAGAGPGLLHGPRLRVEVPVPALVPAVARGVARVAVRPRPPAPALPRPAGGPAPAPRALNRQLRGGSRLGG